jgi:microcystin-dependent protein
MDAFLGSIQLVAFNFAPNGFVLCNGQLMPIGQNAALYSLLGTTYGGDGKSTFALPKLSSPIEGLNFVIAIQGLYPTRP